MEFMKNEKKNGQDFILNVSYDLSFTKIYEHKFIIDYSEVYKEIKLIFSEKRHDLLESLAMDIAKRIKVRFNAIETIKVSITKIKPEGCDKLESVSVTYEI